MQVGNIVQEKITSLTKKRKMAGGQFMAEEAEEAQSHEINSAKVSISSLWTLQIDTIDNYANDIETMKHVGGAIIDELNNIRIGIISGEISKEDMQHLNDALNNAKIELQFPDLQNIINDIRLRAEVELAKLEYSTEEQ